MAVNASLMRVYFPTQTISNKLQIRVMAAKGEPLAKRRRKGGIRQRLAACEEIDSMQEDQMQASSPSSSSRPTTLAPSKLVKNLLRDFAWGAMSAQKLQEICMSSVQDLEALNRILSGNEKWPTNAIQTDQTKVAKIGASGQYSNKCYGDLMKIVEANIKLPEPHRVYLRFAPPLGDQVQEMLLPHETFAALFQCKATWNKVILPNIDLPSEFWSAQENKHPQWQGHPIAKMNPKQLQYLIPLSLHGDEVPVTGVGKQWSRKMVNFSWHSLLSNTASVRDSQFFIWALFDKAGVHEEDDGYNTMWKFFEILSWSFEFLFKGIYPTHDVNGKALLGSKHCVFRLLVLILLFLFFLSMLLRASES